MNISNNTIINERNTWCKIKTMYVMSRQHSIFIYSWEGRRKHSTCFLFYCYISLHCMILCVFLYVGNTWTKRQNTEMHHVKVLRSCISENELLFLDKETIRFRVYWKIIHYRCHVSIKNITFVCGWLCGHTMILSDSKETHALVIKVSHMNREMFIQNYKAI